MTPGFEVVLVLGGFLALLAMGMTIPLAILLPAITYLLIDGGWSSLNSLGFLAWGSMNSGTLVALPLFILMAEILTVSGLSSGIYKGMDTLIGRLPGGLLQTNIAGCAIFSSVCGSSMSTAAAIGRIALPQLDSRKYDPALAAGSLAAGGTLGILIPPSIALIVYSTFTDTSVPKLFLASMLPGILLALMFMLYIAIYSHIRPVSMSSAGRERPTFREVMGAIGNVLPFFVLIGGTLGVLYTGLATTSEAAVIGCVLSTLLGLSGGSLTFTKFRRALQSTILVSGNMLFIVLAAFIFSSAVSFAGIDHLITEFINGLQLTKFQFFLVVFVLFIVMGMLVESMGMLVITVPLLYPMLSHYDIDPLAFGVLVVLFVELAQITPPMGINLFVIQGMWNGRIVDVIRGVVPFTIIILGLALLLTIWPEIALWLPNMVHGR